MSSDYAKETWVDEILAGAETYNVSGTGAGQTIALDQTVVTPGTGVDAVVMQNIEDQLEKDDIFLREVATEKTVSGGVLTCDLSRHKIQPQTGTSDDIDTISGLEADTFAILFASDPGTDTLTFKHGTGNISCFGGSDIELSEGMVVCYYDGTTVYVAGGGGGGTPESAYPTGHLFGLTLSNNVGDATNDIDIAVGNARDSTDAEDAVLASVLTKRLDAAWAVGTNQGGRDTGAIANDTYHVFLIKRSDTGVVDALFSISPTAPTMPANYDYKRRIGSIVRTGAAIIAFVQIGDKFIWKVPVQDLNETNPGTAAVTRTLTLPTDIRVEALVSTRGYGNTNADNPQFVFLTDLSITDTAPSASAFHFVGYVASAVIQTLGGGVQVFTNTSAQIRSRVSVSGATTILTIVTLGWIDTRGRLG